MLSARFSGTVRLAAAAAACATLAACVIRVPTRVTPTGRFPVDAAVDVRFDPPRELAIHLGARRRVVCVAGVEQLSGRVAGTVGATMYVTVTTLRARGAVPRVPSSAVAIVPLDTGTAVRVISRDGTSAEGLFGGAFVAFVMLIYYLGYRGLGLP